MADDEQGGQGAGRRATAPWGWWAALAAPWLACAWWLWPAWGFAVENHYGYAVFPLAAYLLLLRWEAPPSALPARGRLVRLGWVALASAGLVLLAGGGLFLGASPLWTQAMWLAVAGAVIVSCALLGRAGGWAWLRHGLFPLLFTCTALPWPSRIEEPTMGWLRNVNAQCAAEIVSVLGRPAVARGTVIETSGGFAGVEDACSGIVALQTALMLAFFFGELRRLRLRDRIGLVAGAVVIALLVNMARASWLVWLTVEGRADAMHDLAGTIELLVAIVAVAAWSMWYGTTAAQRPVAAVVMPQLRSWSAMVVASVAAVVIGVSAWYIRGPLPAAKYGWQMEAPDAEWRIAPLGDHALRQLQPSESRYLLGKESATGRDWVALYLRWEADPGFGFGAAGHGPEICLPASGAKLEDDLQGVVFKVAGREVLMHALRFRAGADEFYTFSFLWDSIKGESADFALHRASMGMLGDRLDRVREGRKYFGLERITIAVNRCRDSEEAVAKVTQMLPRLLQPR